MQRAYHRTFGVRITHAWGMTETSPVGSISVPLAAHASLESEALAAVVGIAHPRWDERPLACVVRRKTEAGPRLTKDALLEHLRPHVARFWLPEGVVFIDEVPKTSVGKFDKKVLRQRFQDYFTRLAAGGEA